MRMIKVWDAGKAKVYVSPKKIYSLHFVRLHTFGRGDVVCDFQYCRVQKAQNQTILEE